MSSKYFPSESCRIICLFFLKSCCEFCGAVGKKRPHKEQQVLPWQCARLIILARAQTEASDIEKDFSAFKNAITKTSFYCDCVRSAVTTLTEAFVRVRSERPSGPLFQRGCWCACSDWVVAFSDFHSATSRDQHFEKRAAHLAREGLCDCGQCCKSVYCSQF